MLGRKARPGSEGKPVMRSVRPRWILGALLAFLVAVGGMLMLVNRDSPDDPSILGAELDEFDPPPDSDALPIVLNPCEGDDSFPPSATRTIVVADDRAALDHVAVTAEGLGWSSSEPGSDGALVFVRSGRALFVEIVADREQFAMKLTLSGLSLRC